jgi:hypothetical protein
LIYRRPFQPEVIGMDISSGAILRAYRDQGPVGTAMMTAKVDEIERLYSYRHLQRFPSSWRQACRRTIFLLNGNG